MSLTIHDEIIQGTPEWHDVRRGIITASTVGSFITPSTVKPSKNDNMRGMNMKLIAERITGYTEPSPTSAPMERGTLDEPYARDIYSANYAEAVVVGFMIREYQGNRIGYSPDGVVGDNGLIEIKSRTQQLQVATIVRDAVPSVNMAQVQCGLLVSGRDWCDYVSYCSGMPFYVKRVYPDLQWFEVILEVVATFEEEVKKSAAKYKEVTAGAPMTERIDHYAEIGF